MGNPQSQRTKVRWSANDHPFLLPLNGYVLTVHPKRDVDRLQLLLLLLLSTGWTEHQCQRKMIVSLIPTSSHEINITWQFL